MSAARGGYWARRLVRNLGIVSGALMVHLVVVTIKASPDVGATVYRVSLGTGYASVVLIAWAMLIGPWRVRRGRPAPASTDLRRDVGVWGGLFALAHVVTGLQVHFAGAIWKYFVYPTGDHRIPVRYDLFGFANWTGLAATLVLLLLLAISNDASLRALGTRRWKSWQRWTYWAGGFTVAHALAYQIETRHFGGWIAAVVLGTIVVLIMQLDGRRRMRARAMNPGRPRGELPA